MNLFVANLYLTVVVSVIIPLLLFVIFSNCNIYKRLVFLILYLFIILYATLIHRSIGDRHSIRIFPFWSYRFLFDHRIRNEVILNVLLFIPFGFILGWTERVRFKICIIIAALTSILIEATQYIFCLGLCEFDDVFHNTLGTVLGYWYWRGLERVYRKIKRRADYKKDVQ